MNTGCISGAPVWTHRGGHFHTFTEPLIWYVKSLGPLFHIKNLSPSYHRSWILEDFSTRRINLKLFSDSLMRYIVAKAFHHFFHNTKPSSLSSRYAPPKALFWFKILAFSMISVILDQIFLLSPSTVTPEKVCVLLTYTRKLDKEKYIPYVILQLFSLQNTF